MTEHDAFRGGGDSGLRHQSEAARRAPDESGPELAQQARNELTGAVRSATRAGRPDIPDARAEPAEESTELSTRDALVDVAVLGHRLARLLDGLASRYATPGTARPPDAHVSLDQAAAAAEDLGNSAQTAARAIEDEEDTERRR